MAIQPRVQLGTLYKQYKADNARLANWLGRTALRHGYSRGRLRVRHAGPVGAGGGAGSGTEGDGGADSERTAKQIRNARKKAKQRQLRREEKYGVGEGITKETIESAETGREQSPPNATAAANSPTSAPKPEASPTAPQQYIISIQDHIDLAEYLVKSEVSVPSQLLSTLDRCIRLRRRIGEYYTEDKGSDGQAGHEHFVIVLEKVQSLLSRLPSHGADSTDTQLLRRQDSPPSLIPRSQNQYAELDDGALLDDPEVDEEAELADGPESLNPGDKVKPCKVDTFETTDSPFDVAMQIIMFLEEAHNVRSVIKRMWREYRSGDADLITVGLASNTAIDLLEEQYRKLEPRIKATFGEDTGAMLRSLAARSRAAPVSPDRSVLDCAQTHIDVLPSDGFFLVSRWERIEYAASNNSLLDQFVAMAPPGMPKPPPHSRPPKPTPPAGMAMELELFDRILDKFGNFGFMHTFIDALTSAEGAQSCSFDATTRALTSSPMFGLELDTSLFATIVATICTDVALVLGTDVEKPLHHMRAQIKRMEKEWDTYKADIPQVRPTLSADLHRWLDIFEGVKTFVIMADGGDAAKKNKGEVLGLMPIYCGRLLAYVALHYHAMAMAMVTGYQAIPVAAHFYLVAKNRTEAAPGRRELGAWKDMDELARLCGNEHIYGCIDPGSAAGSAPSLEDIRRSLHESSGFVDRLDNKSAAHSPKVGASSKFNWRASRNSMTDGRRVLAFYTWDVSTPADGSRAGKFAQLREYVSAILLQVHLLKQDRQPSRTSKTTGKPPRRKQLSTADIIESLVCILEDEVPVLYFDILAFDRDSSRFLSILHRIGNDINRDCEVGESYTFEGDEPITDRCSPANLFIVYMSMVENNGMLVKGPKGRFRRIKTLPTISHAYMRELRFGMREMMRLHGDEHVRAMAERMASRRAGASGAVEDGDGDGDAVESDTVDDALGGDRPEKPLALAKLRQYLALARNAIKPMPIADALVMDHRFGRSTSG